MPILPEVYPYLAIRRRLGSQSLSRKGHLQIQGVSVHKNTFSCGFPKMKLSQQ